MRPAAAHGESNLSVQFLDEFMYADCRLKAITIHASTALKLP